MSKLAGVDRAALESFHSSIAVAFSKAVSAKAKVSTVGEFTDWEGSIAGTKVYFEMRPATEDSAIQTFVGDRGGQRILFPLNNPEPVVPTWASWSEEWRKKAADPKERKPKPMLDLVGVSLAFYVGNPWNQKTQIIRAEWDDPSVRGLEAAQPHWHIDPKLMDVPSWQSPLIGDIESDEAVELGATDEVRDIAAPGFWSLQKLHLGMAGWSHAPDTPRCWQHDIGLPQLREIAGWLTKVIIYCKREMQKVTGER